MNILVLGGGGREHAIAWAIAQNPKCDQVFAAPGNPGIAEVATCLDLDILDGDAVAACCRANEIGFVVIGPEAPLAAGVADRLRADGVPVLGPSRAAAQLEASKAFTKEICRAAGVPTAEALAFDALGPARDYLRGRSLPIVVKADGLAAGKGVTVAETRAEAAAALEAIFAAPGPGETNIAAPGARETHVAAPRSRETDFPAPKPRAVIEEFMPGEEASFFVLTDGAAVLPLGTAQDHKRAFDGDHGPNTGGMGAYSPAPVMTPELVEATLARVIRPTLAEMARRGTPYQGVLYAGLMIADGAPRLVEYNVRLGDPEAQVLMLRLGAQFLDAALAAAEGRLAGVRLNWAEDHALAVVLAARGYPGGYARGEPIGLSAPRDPLVQIFHAGTRAGANGLMSNGGRVLNVAARGASLRAARDRAYAEIGRIDWPGAQYRCDIGWRALDG